MSLYNMVFGMNPDTDKLLKILGKTQGDFGRFRNVYMEDGYIVVHTRNGGGNREDYEDVFEEMEGIRGTAMMQTTTSTAPMLTSTLRCPKTNS